MTAIRPEFGLERLLSALSRDLLEASDEEVLDAARELAQTTDAQTTAPPHAAGTSFGANATRQHLRLLRPERA